MLLNITQKLIKLQKVEKNLRICLELITSFYIKSKLVIMERMFQPKVCSKISIKIWINMPQRRIMPLMFQMPKLMLIKMLKTIKLVKKIKEKQT